ncbi:hypothetical protein FB446DRAFT_788898 [Lentinula raphanica]|nr:hypothetical protein FB446DRAFT_788898 [Lentinula raphanica]
MRSHLSLPDEFLYFITEYIAYAPKRADWYPKSLFQCASPELLALSVANWRLRQICVPFLFANVKIRHDKDAEGLIVYLGLVSKFTKILVLGSDQALTKLGNQIISRTLPQLKQLFHVELRTFLVYELPLESVDNYDLSKIILVRQQLPSYYYSADYRNYLNRGMKLMCLELFNLNEIGNMLVSQTISGLEAIELRMDIESVSFSWLSSLLSANPTLNELSLIDGRGQFCAHDVPPFLTLLLKQIQRPDPHNFFVIIKASLHRAKPIGQSTQDWYFSGLTLYTGTFANHSLIELLPQFASLFPKLETLSLGLPSHPWMYHIDSLASAFARFSSLRVVFLDHFFHRLKFGLENENLRLMSPVQPLDSTVNLGEISAHAERKLLLFSSCLAKQIRTLDSIHIKEMGMPVDLDTYWYLSGWLHVLNSDRDVGGTLRRNS